MPLSKFLAETPCLVCPPRARRKQARPGELLDAALDLFVEKGFAATRAEEVAKRAGVSKGTLFLYFASKEELFKAVVRKNLSEQFPHWNERLQAFEGSSAELLQLFYQTWWDCVGATKTVGLTKLILSEAGNFPEIAAFYRQEVIEPSNALIRRMIQRGVQRGEFRSVNLDHAMYSVLSPMLFLVMWRYSVPPNAPAGLASPLDPAKFLFDHAQTLLRGLAHETPESSAS